MTILATVDATCKLTAKFKMERVKICCLKGVGPGTKSNKIIALEGRDEATIGRTDDNTVSISSNMISRKHAILNKKNDCQWTITDNKSLNGIFINGERLKPGIPHQLNEHDTVQLGVKTSADKPAEFVWTFYTKLGVKKLRKPSGQDESLSSQQDSQAFKPTQKVNQNKNRCPDENTPMSTHSLSTHSPSRHASKRARLSSPIKSWSPTAEMHRKLAEQEEQAKQQILEQQQKLAEMQKLLAERDATQEKLQEQLREKEENMKEELQKQQEALEAQRIQFEEEVKRNFEEQIKEKEESLLGKLQQEKERLIEERLKVEESLQTEMERKLGEKDKKFHEKLLKEKEALDKVIKQKEAHQKMLETQLNETKTENEKQKETMLKAKEDILSNFTDLIETELQCSICSELFVQATSLNCSHSFCASCIGQWMKVKKECPVCRAKITSSLRSIVLDNYIDAMVLHLSEEMKERRQALVDERKADEQVKKEAEAAASASTTGGRGGRGSRGRGGGRGGGRRRNTGNNLMAGNPQSDTTTATGDTGRRTRQQAAETVVVTSSDVEPDIDHVAEFVDLGSSFSEDSSDSVVLSDGDSDSSVEGVNGAYYGGYGTCYICGNRGHWANGCPFL